MFDKYDFADELHTVFYMNTDFDCALEYKLDPEMPHIILFVHDAEFH